MVDHVRVTLPRLLRPLEGLLRKALQRHARIQCAEDESYRARRAELRERGIVQPLSLFNTPLWESQTRSLSVSGRGPHHDERTEKPVPL